MAETDTYAHHQRLVSDLASPTPQTQHNPTKISSHFIYRSLFVAIFVVLLPLFPSHAPEFFNQAIITRSWEFLHLLLVGIALSYGFLSRRNIEAEKESQSKNDNAHSYVSRILQVSSVFDDDEGDSPSGSDDSKIQTWNSRYFREDPVVVVAPEGSRPSSRRGSGGGEKPLLLPVRSLKSRIPEPEEPDVAEGRDGFLAVGNGSVLYSSSSSNSPIRMKNASREMSGVGAVDLEQKSTESVVLPSPIPWRSRSGRMEYKEESGAVTPPSYSLPPAANVAEFDRFESQGFRSSTPRLVRSNSSSSPSPKKLSPAPSLSPELRAKISEDSGKKKSLSRHAPPPPPPPPPPPMSNKKRPTVENSTPIRDGFSSEKKVERRRSFTDGEKDPNRSSREDILPARNDLGLEHSRQEARSKPPESSPVPKSVRTIRGTDFPVDVKKAREMGSDGIEVNNGKRAKDVEAVVMEKAGTKTGGYQTSVGAEKPARKVYFEPPKYQKEKELAEKIALDSEDSDSDDIRTSTDGEEVASNGVGETEQGANEVDKKADEFIAKFREQIRLQRIESIKKSTGQRSVRTPR